VAQLVCRPRGLLSGLCASFAVFAVKFVSTAKFAKNCQQEREGKHPADIETEPPPEAERSPEFSTISADPCKSVAEGFDVL
jgi:hypothetical protein